MATETESQLRGDEAQDGAGAAEGDYDVELRSITKRFGAVVAVDDSTHSGRRGEVMSRRGPAG